MIIEVYLGDRKGNPAPLIEATQFYIQIDHLTIMELIKALGEAIGQEIAKKGKES